MRSGSVIHLSCKTVQTGLDSLLDVIQSLEIGASELEHIRQLVHIFLADRIIRYRQIVDDDQSELILGCRLRRRLGIFCHTVQSVQDGLSVLSTRQQVQETVSKV